LEGDHAAERVAADQVRARRLDCPHHSPSEAAAIAESYIGINRRFIEKALEHNRPSIHALSNQDAMDEILSLMAELGYVDQLPTGYADLTHLNALIAAQQPA